LSPYDTVINTDHMDIAKAIDAVIKCLPSVWLLKGNVPLMKRAIKAKK
jgi:hypothetical protein